METKELLSYYMHRSDSSLFWGQPTI